MKDTGGYLIPQVVAERLWRRAIDEMDSWLGDLLATMPPPPPLSQGERLRRRLRLARLDTRDWLHDRLFPSCRPADPWDD